MYLKQEKTLHSISYGSKCAYFLSLLFLRDLESVGLLYC